MRARRSSPLPHVVEGFEEQLVIDLVLVCIGLRKLAERVVDARALPQVAGNGVAVTRAGVRMRQGPGAQRTKA